MKKLISLLLMLVVSGAALAQTIDQRLPAGSVTDAMASLANKPSAFLASTSNIASLSGLPTIDGVTMTRAGVVLLAGQTTQSQNGPWCVPASGAWARCSWYPAAGTTQAFVDETVQIRAGNTYSGSLFKLATPTSGAIIIGTTATTWTISPVALGAIAPVNSGTIVGNCTGSTTAPAANSVLCVAGPASTSISIVGPVPQWIHVGSALSYAAFSTAATTNNIALFTLPAGGVVHAIKIKHSMAFAGTAITNYQISVGTSASPQLLAPTFSVFQATGGSVLQLSTDFYTFSDTATQAVVATATSTGANLSAATSGAVDIWAFISVDL